MQSSSPVSIDLAQSFTDGEAICCAGGCLIVRGKAGKVTVDAVDLAGQPIHPTQNFRKLARARAWAKKIAGIKQ